MIRPALPRFAAMTLNKTHALPTFHDWEESRKHAKQKQSLLRDMIQGWMDKDPTMQGLPSSITLDYEERYTLLAWLTSFLPFPPKHGVWTVKNNGKTHLQIKTKKSNLEIPTDEIKQTFQQVSERLLTLYKKDYPPHNGAL